MRSGGATTFSGMTLGITIKTTLGIFALGITINDIQCNNKKCGTYVSYAILLNVLLIGHAKRHYAEFHIFYCNAKCHYT